MDPLSSPRRKNPSPFESSPNGKTLELDFLTAFELAVKAPLDGPSELGAYRELEATYRLAIANMDDRAPTLVTFMQWAARELGELEPSSA